MKSIIKSPVRDTLITLGVSFIAYLVLTLVSLYMTRVMCSAQVEMTGTCHGTNLQMFGSMIVNDFALIFRVATELLILILASQLIYRLTTKRTK